MEVSRKLLYFTAVNTLHPQTPTAMSETSTTVNPEVKDFEVNDHFSLVILTPMSGEAIEWSKENLPSDAQRWNEGYVVERRYIDPILDGITEAGLTY